MARCSSKIEVYLETGKKRTFASAIHWPGWCRGGRDEHAALQALCNYGTRYASIPRLAQLEFDAPADVSVFAVIERLEGDAVTDFGAPGKPPSWDALPVDEAELVRFQTLLKACWQAFDEAARAATGKELHKGARGGGRNLEGIIQHVLSGEVGYLSRLGRKLQKGEGEHLDEEVSRSRQEILDALGSAGRGEIPTQGPRGGVHWTARYFVRRVAWHVLDHAWELEERGSIGASWQMNSAK